MRDQIKIKNEITAYFKELIIKYPKIDSLSCDINTCEGNEFAFEYR